MNSNALKWRSIKNETEIFDDAAKKCRGSFDQHDVKSQEKMILQGVQLFTAKLQSPHTCIFKHKNSYHSCIRKDAIHWNCNLVLEIRTNLIKSKLSYTAHHNNYRITQIFKLHDFLLMWIIVLFNFSEIHKAIEGKIV